MVRPSSLSRESTTLVSLDRAQGHFTGSAPGQRPRPVDREARAQRCHRFASPRERALLATRGENVGDRYIRHTSEQEVLELIVSGTPETALTADEALQRAA